LVLEQYLGEPANTIRLVTSPSGKPFIGGTTQVHFILRHADDVALVAVSCDVEVGVDVEAIQLDFRINEMEACFTDPELRMLDQSSSAEERATVFFRLWTRKEAVLKADGSGLGTKLRDIDVSRAPEDLVRVDTNRQQLWRVDDLALAPGYAGALAASPGDWQVRWRRLADLSLP
jgi:4'-phosphopantetheinyl transferase